MGLVVYVRNSDGKDLVVISSSAREDGQWVEVEEGARADRWSVDGQGHGVEVAWFGSWGVLRRVGEGQTLLKTMAVCCLPGLANMRKGGKENRPIWARKNKEK
jgi:hypothetical protein